MPVKCAMCPKKNATLDDSNAVKCSKCGLLYHPSCAKRAKINADGWVSFCCYSTAADEVNEVNDLDENSRVLFKLIEAKFNGLEVKFNGLDSKIDNTLITVKEKLCELDDRVLKLEDNNVYLLENVISEINKRNSKECNCIIYKLEDSENAVKKDIELFKNLLACCNDEPSFNINDIKLIRLGLYYPFEFASVVKIFGRSKQDVIFKEEEWIQFHEQRENINKYFQTFDTMWKPRQIGSKTLTFEMIEEKKILKIEDMPGNEVYLGWESVPEVWSLESVLRYRLSYSYGSNFKYIYEDVIRAVAEISGDVKINIYNIINRLSEKSDGVCYMLEILLFMPENALFDVQLERRIQKQDVFKNKARSVLKTFIKKMWMLYAQEHWTKALDLKSAVERLYEELGA
ncbi:hypothetical protein FQA39_LY16931 [Lamprigera yunnana]|nr:hypothetical protein FQA39_LY16931 [Lamprigera yunnana]